MLFNNSFILASASTSRFRILKNNKLIFSRVSPACDESSVKKSLLKTKTTPAKISMELARLKAKSVSQKKPKQLVVGCDTVIDFQGVLLNKSKNLKESKQQILLLSGKTHRIFSSASVFCDMKEIWKKTQKSTVKIRILKEKEVDRYLFLTGKQILQSVGCYQIESLGPNIIENINGDFFNVMGFPLFPFLKFLNKYKGTIS